MGITHEQSGRDVDRRHYQVQAAEDSPEHWVRRSDLNEREWQESKSGVAKAHFEHESKAKRAGGTSSVARATTNDADETREAGQGDRDFGDCEKSVVVLHLTSRRPTDRALSCAARSAFWGSRLPDHHMVNHTLAVSLHEEGLSYEVTFCLRKALLPENSNGVGASDE